MRRGTTHLVMSPLEFMRRLGSGVDREQGGQSARIMAAPDGRHGPCRVFPDRGIVTGECRGRAPP